MAATMTILTKGEPANTWSTVGSCKEAINLPERRYNCYRYSKESHSSNEARLLYKETRHRVGTSQCLTSKAVLNISRNANRRNNHTPRRTYQERNRLWATTSWKKIHTKVVIELKIVQIEIDADNLHKFNEEKSLESSIAKAGNASEYYLL